MKDFFKGVRKHIGKLDAEHLREQYSLVTDELAFSEMIFHTTSDGYLVLDAAGSPRWANPAAGKLLGMKPEDILPTLDVPLSKSSKREIEISYPDRRFLEMQTFPMGGGETLVKLADVTANREKSEEELRAGATQAVRDLASGVAHEIGNPLNAISLNLQILKEDPSDREAVDVCIAEVKRLDGILKGFLQALKPSRPNLMPGSPAVPLKDCLEALKAQLEDRRISVAVDMPGALPAVALDPAKIQQVYFNLLKNALEAIHDGGAIRIEVGSDDDDVFVAFRDNGEGMDADRLAHLFEPYRTSKEHGTGLGLMISQRIVRDHGGRIDVESAPGEGTTFTIRLPRIERRVRALKQPNNQTS